MATLTIKFTDKELATIAAGITAAGGASSDGDEDTETAAEKKARLAAAKKAKATKEAAETEDDDNDDGLDDDTDDDLDGLDDDDDGGDPDEPTAEDVRRALKEYSQIEGKPAAIKIIKDVAGASSMADVKPKFFKKVIAACDA